MPRTYIEITGREEFRVERNPFGYGIKLRFGTLRPDGRWDVAVPLQMEVQDRGAPVEPFLGIHDETAQQLMDELWRIGIRPGSGDFGISHVQALMNHIESLKSEITFLRSKITET